MATKRQRDVPDDADEKWKYTEHAAAKHEILRRYLGAWLAILGRGKKGFRHKELVLLDGFAGRGRYIDGEAGSPRIMFERAVETVDAGLAGRVLIACAEPNAGNFKLLEEVCAELNHANVVVDAKQETFQERGTKLAEWAEKQKPAAPIFVMVDPYGVTGVELSLIERLLKNDRVEVLLTFMVRDPSRFLKEDNYAEPMTAMFGGEAWRSCEDADDRATCLMLKFREVVTPDIAQYSLAFKVYEDHRKTPLYYLIHLTNKSVGMREMKKAMIKKSGEMTFWPVTLRPPDQLALEVAEVEPFPTLQVRLREKYAGKTLTFGELLDDDYPDGVWLEPNYRAALVAMAAEPSEVSIIRNRVTPSGKPATRGIQEPDSLTFP